MNSIEGIFPALATPYGADGRIDDAAVGILVETLLSTHVDGFYVGGSTGEAFLLSTEERKRLLEIVHAAVGGRAFIIAHIGSPSTATAIELARHAQEVGADLVSSVPPFYYKYSIEEIIRYYLDIVRNVELPLILYNIPSLSGVNLDSENARPLLEHERIIGVKHTSMDLYELERMKHLSTNVSVLNGHEEVFLAGLVMGADGAVGSTFNIMADRFIRIRQAFLDGRLLEAMELQRSANDVIALLKRVGVFQGIKYLLKLKGIGNGECRAPFRSLTAGERTLLEENLCRL